MRIFIRVAEALLYTASAIIFFGIFMHVFPGLFGPELFDTPNFLVPLTIRLVIVFCFLLFEVVLIFRSYKIVKAMLTKE